MLSAGLKSLWEVKCWVLRKSVQLLTEQDSKEDRGELKEDRAFAFPYGKGKMTGILQIQEYRRMSK